MYSRYGYPYNYDAEETVHKKASNTWVEQMDTGQYSGQSGFYGNSDYSNLMRQVGQSAVSGNLNDYRADTAHVYANNTSSNLLSHMSDSATYTQRSTYGRYDQSTTGHEQQRDSTAVRGQSGQHAAVTAPREDELDVTDFTVRMAAALKKKTGKVDVSKILKVMQLVEQMPDTELEERSNQGGSSAVIQDVGQWPYNEQGLKYGQDQLGLSRVQGISSSQGIVGQGSSMDRINLGLGTPSIIQASRMDMLNQGSGVDILNQRSGMADKRYLANKMDAGPGFVTVGYGRAGKIGSSTGIMSQSASFGNTNQGAGIGMIGPSATGIDITSHGAGIGRTGQHASTGNVSRGAGISMTGQHASSGNMSRGAGIGMTGQSVGIGRTGQRAENVMMDLVPGKDFSNPRFDEDVMNLKADISMFETEVGLRPGMQNTARLLQHQRFLEQLTMRDDLIPRRQHKAYEEQRMSRKRAHPKSLLDMDIPVPEQFRKKEMKGDKPRKRNQSGDSSMPSKPTTPVKMSLEKKLQSFIKILKKEDLTRNPISLLHLTIHKHKLDLEIDYQSQPVLGIDNGQIFRGTLHISGVFLAEFAQKKKKKVKYECYFKALNDLLTKPVQVLIKQKVDKKNEKVETQLTETENKIKMLWEHMKSLSLHGLDPVTVLIDAIKASECGLDYSYAVRETTCVRSGVPWFTGELTILKTLIGAGAGPTEEKARRKTFSKALDFFTKQPFSTIIRLGLKLNEWSLRPGFEVLSIDLPELPTENTPIRLTKMMKLIKDLHGNKKVRHIIDTCARKSDLVLTRLYKRSKLSPEKQLLHECEIYLDHIFICVGEHQTKTGAENEAYLEALTVLTASSADVIFNDFKRMSWEDAAGVIEVTDVWADGERRSQYFSNAGKVGEKNRSFANPEEDQKCIYVDPDEMIIFEHEKSSKDRYRNAYDILQVSANKNHMILQGRTTVYRNTHKCQLFLQHEKVAFSSMNGPCSNIAPRTQAAASLLFKLYQKQPTIMIKAAKEDGDICLTYETLKAKADTLKEEMGDTGTDDFIYISTTEASIGDEEKMDIQEGNEEKMDVQEGNEDNSPSSTLPVNKWLKQIIEATVEQFAKKETLVELKFTGEFSPGDLKQLNLTTRKYGLSKVHKCAFYQRHSAKKMLEILQMNNGQCGRYAIIPKESLPGPDDLEKYRRGDSTSKDSLKEPGPKQSQQQK